MATLSPEELLRLWTAEKLSIERAIGQVLQHLVKLQAAHQALSHTLHRLQMEQACPQGEAAQKQSQPYTSRRAKKR